MSNTVKIYADGACSGNPGPGGFGVIIKTPAGAGVLTYEYSAAYSWTTNNRMELLGVIYGLEQVKTGSNIDIITDSKYVCDSIVKGWILGWIKNGWKTSSRKPVANKDLWLRYLKASNGKNIDFHWIKGHNNHPENERCDSLAVNAYTNTASKDMMEDGFYLLSNGYEAAETLSDVTLKEMVNQGEISETYVDRIMSWKRGELSSTDLYATNGGLLIQ